MKEPLRVTRWLLAIAVGILFPWLLAAMLGAFLENLSLPAREYAWRTHGLSIPFWASWVVTTLVAALLGLVVGKLLAAVEGSIGNLEFSALAAAAVATLVLPELFTAGSTLVGTILLAMPNLAAGLAGISLGSRARGCTANAA